MSLEPDTAADYAGRGVQAMRSVLVELGQVLGSFRDAIVLVGGAVPWLRFPDVEPPHVGSLDVDLDLDVELLAEGRYAELVETLQKAGYERDIEGLKPFQLRRWVPVGDGRPVPVIVDLLMPRDAEPKKNRPKLVEGLRVQGCDGAEIALANFTELTLDGWMPDGRPNSVRLRVATIPAMLAMKGYALEGRDKKKDAYDIWYSVRNAPGGPAHLATECIPLLADPAFRQGFEHIAWKFRDAESFGPATVRAFLAPTASIGGMTPDQIQTDAFRQVNALLQAMGITETPRPA